MTSKRIKSTRIKRPPIGLVLNSTSETYSAFGFATTAPSLNWAGKGNPPMMSGLWDEAAADWECAYCGSFNPEKHKSKEYKKKTLVGNCLQCGAPKTEWQGRNYGGEVSYKLHVPWWKRLLGFDKAL